MIVVEKREIVPDLSCVWDCGLLIIRAFSTLYAGAIEAYGETQMFIHGNTFFEENTAAVEGGEHLPVNC